MRNLIFLFAAGFLMFILGEAEAKGKKRGHKKGGHFFQKFDTNGDGEISIEELKDSRGKKKSEKKAGSDKKPPEE